MPVAVPPVVPAFEAPGGDSVVVFGAAPVPVVLVVLPPRFGDAPSVVTVVEPVDEDWVVSLPPPALGTEEGGCCPLCGLPFVLGVEALGGPAIVDGGKEDWVDASSTALAVEALDAGLVAIHAPPAMTARVTTHAAATPATTRWPLIAAVVGHPWRLN